MNEEPKARPSINLDELERQLREASRIQAFRHGGDEHSSYPDRVHARDEGLGTDLPGTGRRGEDLKWKTEQSDSDFPDEKDGDVPFSQNEAGTQGQFPPSFLMSARDDRFPEVGSVPEDIGPERSWRSVFVIAVLILFIVSGVYGYLHLSKDFVTSGVSDKVPVIKADTAPTRVKPEVAADSTKSTSGPNLFSNKENTEGAPAVVVSSKEQPVDLSAKSQTSEPPAGQSSNGDGITTNQTGVGGTASSSASVGDATAQGAAVAGPKPVRTVTVKADGTIIDPAGVLKLPPTNTPQASPTDASTQTDKLTGTPETATNQPEIASTSVASEVEKVNSGSSVPLPPRRPSDLDAEAVASEPIEAVSGLLDNVPENSTNVATPSPDTTAAVALTAGAFSVQFGAPATDSEARALIGRVKTRLGDALADTEIGVFKGENSGRTVFRVRIVNVSKSDGQELCDRYIASGGQCFVTRN